MSFRRKTILGVALIGAILLGLLVATGISFVLASADSELRDRATTLARLLAATATDPVLATNLGQLDSIAGELASAPAVSYVRILDIGGSPLAEAGNLPADRRSGPATDLVARHDITIAGMTLGRVEIGLSTDSTDTRTERQILWISIVAVIELGLVVAFSYVFGTYLTRRLAKLETGAERMMEGDFSHRIPLAGSDEIGRTARAFNEMADRTRQLLAKVTESERRFRDYSDIASDWLWEMDADLRFSFFSPRFEEVTGIEETMLLGRRRWEVGNEQEDYASAKWVGHKDDLFNHRPFRDFEYRVMTGTQRVCWFAINGKPLFDETGAFAGYRGTGRDITERRLAQEALIQSEERFKLAVSGTSDGLWDWDLLTDKIWYSTVWQRLIGFSDAEMASYRWMDHLHPDDAERMRAAVRTHLVGDSETFAEIYRHRHGKRGWIWVEARGACLRDKDGFPVRFTGRLSDITERKEAEEALERRTRELERSNAELEQFAYIASHDLQEPLRMVSSYVSLLARRYKGQLAPDVDEYIGFVEDGTLRMSQLIRDLLDFSRVGTRGGAMVPTLSDECLTAARKDLATAIEDSGARIERPMTLPEVLADPPQLTRLFQNLLGNALKYRDPSRPVEIRVSALRQGAYWRFDIEDNGIGIDPEFHERIFLIFQRLHTHEQYSGTGIGLAICKKIVERHGGRIWVASRPGDGAIFSFTLPAATPA